MSPLSRRQLLAAGAGVLAAFAGCTGVPNRSLPEPPRGDWRQRGHDERNTGVSDVSVPPRGTPAWDAGEAYQASPLVDDDAVYTVAGEATKLDGETGDELWETGLPETARHTPALLGDRLVVPAGDRLVALDREAGDELWTARLGRPARDAVVAPPDGRFVAVPVAETGVVVFDPSTGDRLWRGETLGARQPAVADGTVYVTGYRQDGNTGVVRALEAADGTTRWDRDLESPDTAPVVADDALLVTDDGRVGVRDPGDGELRRYLTDRGGRFDVPPAVADGTAYVPDGRALVAVSVADGTEVWRADASVAGETGVSVGRDAVVVPVSDAPEAGLPGVVAFERSDGSLRWEYSIEGFDVVVSTPAVLADGAVFVSSNESSGVVALGDLPPEDG